MVSSVMVQVRICSQRADDLSSGKVMMQDALQQGFRSKQEVAVELHFAGSGLALRDGAPAIVQRKDQTGPILRIARGKPLAPFSGASEACQDLSASG